MSNNKKDRIIRVAMIKAESKWGDVKFNINFLEKLCKPLAKNKIDVVITPECFLDGYMVRKEKECTVKKLSARSVSGYNHPVIKHVSEIAKYLKCYIVIGASEKKSPNVIKNAAYLIDRKGKPVGTYYKTHPGNFYQPGDNLPVFKTDFGSVGIVICADRRWPENIRCLRLKGAEIILNPTWGMWRGLNTCIMRTRAYENGIPICFTHPYQSLICNSRGDIDAILESNQPAVLIHDIDLNQNIEPGKTKGVADSAPIKNRRPELYNEIIKK